jgi:hypothetical protein
LTILGLLQRPAMSDVVAPVAIPVDAMAALALGSVRGLDAGGDERDAARRP